MTLSAQELDELRLGIVSAGGCDPIYEEVTRQHEWKRRREDITKWKGQWASAPGKAKTLHVVRVAAN